MRSEPAPGLRAFPDWGALPWVEARREMGRGMSTIVASWLFAGALLVGVILMVEAGRRIRARQAARIPGEIGSGYGAVEGAAFALMGLLVAFTFAGAASRFDARRTLIIEEANDIGTAYLRLDLLPEAAQPALREKFRRYVDARIESYELFDDRPAEALGLHQRATALQLEIWRDSVAATQGPDSGPARMLLVPALNAMFDITTSRAAALRTHPPVIIFGLLGVLCLASALFAGYGMAAESGRSWLHIVGFALILAVSVYVILDLEYPRLGLIRVDDFDQFLRDVRAGMG